MGGAGAAEAAGAGDVTGEAAGRSPAPSGRPRESRVYRSWNLLLSSQGSCPVPTRWHG